MTVAGTPDLERHRPRPLLQVAARRAVDAWQSYDPLTMAGHGTLQGAMLALLYAVQQAERNQAKGE